jgi:hypothetical protein
VTVFRLEAERAGGGPHLFPRPFDTVDDACNFAERNIDQLAAHYGWRVRGFRVLELPSMRVATTVPWHDPAYDPDPFGDLFAPASAAGDPGGPAIPAADNTRHPQKRVDLPPDPGLEFDSGVR